MFLARYTIHILEGIGSLMLIFPFMTIKRTRLFFLFLFYGLLVFLIPPISLALFLSTIFSPILHRIHTTFRVPYAFVVFSCSFLFFYAGYMAVHWIIDSFLVLFSQLQSYFALDIFQSPLLSEFSSISLSWIEQISAFVVTTVKNIFQYLLEVIIFLIAFYFSLFESKRDRYWFFVYVPAFVREPWKRYYARAMALFTTFLWVELRLMLLTFCMLGLGFYVLDFTFPWQKALFIAIADCLPFLGIGLVLLPLALYFYITDSIFLCVAILLLYLLTQITRQLTESYLWASTFHMRTIHTFIISAASVYVFGFYGLLLSPFLLLIAVKIRQHPIFGQ